MAATHLIGRVGVDDRGVQRLVDLGGGGRRKAAGLPDEPAEPAGGRVAALGQLGEGVGVLLLPGRAQPLPHLEQLGQLLRMLASGLVHGPGGHRGLAEFRDVAREPYVARVLGRAGLGLAGGGELRRGSA